MPRYFSWIRSSLRRFSLAAVAPFIPRALVQAFGERFGQSVGEGLGHDGVVIVVRGAEPFAQLLQANSAGHGECADVIGSPVSFGAMKSASDRQGSFPSRSACWRRKQKRSTTFLRAAVRVQLHIVAHCVGGEETVHAARRQQFLLDDPIQQMHCLR